MRMSGIQIALAMSAGALLLGCPQEEECDYYRSVAQITSNTEVFQINEEIVLSGSESDVSCGRDHTYSWAFLSVPPDSAITDSVWAGNNTPNGGTQTLNVDVPGSYVVGLTLFDGVQNSVEDILVLEVDADNLAPEADAGDDQGTLVGDLAVLDGSESRDADSEDGLPLEYRWQLEAAPEASASTTANIFGADSPVARFIPDVPGRYVFSLEVKDDFVWSTKDFTTVLAPSDNEPPVAQASDPSNPVSSRTPCESLDPIPLNGSRSYDPDGSELSYEWGVVSKPRDSVVDESSFSDRNSARPLFYSDKPGEYVFELRVSDGELWSAWDTVKVIVADPLFNAPPVANAGSDITIDVETACRETSGGVACNPCPDIAFELNGQEGSVDDDGDVLNYLWLQKSGEDVTITYPGGPITEARTGTFPSEAGKKITRTYVLELQASDCEYTSSDEVTLTYTCTGSD